MRGRKKKNTQKEGVFVSVESDRERTAPLHPSLVRHRSSQKPTFIYSCLALSWNKFTHTRHAASEKQNTWLKLTVFCFSRSSFFPPFLSINIKGRVRNFSNCQVRIRTLKQVDCWSLILALYEVLNTFFRTKEETFTAGKPCFSVSMINVLRWTWSIVNSSFNLWSMFSAAFSEENITDARHSWSTLTKSAAHFDAWLKNQYPTKNCQYFKKDL